MGGGESERRAYLLGGDLDRDFARTGDLENEREFPRLDDRGGGPRGERDRDGVGEREGVRPRPLAYGGRSRAPLEGCTARMGDADLDLERGRWIRGAGERERDGERGDLDLERMGDREGERESTRRLLRGGGEREREREREGLSRLPCAPNGSPRGGGSIRRTPSLCPR